MYKEIVSQKKGRIYKNINSMKYKSTVKPRKIGKKTYTLYAVSITATTHLISFMVVIFFSNSYDIRIQLKNTFETFPLSLEKIKIHLSFNSFH